MLSFLKDLLSDAPEEERSELEVSLAAGVLMFEVAAADHHIGDEELARMRHALATLFSLSDERIDALLARSEALHKDAVGVHEFTREINDEFDEQQKYDIVLQLWRIAMADERVQAIEEHVIRRIADLIYLPHRKFIQAKQAAR